MLPSWNTTDPFGFSNLSKGSIGFDDMVKKLSDLSENLPKLPTYPPYNIKKTGDNTYVVEIAVAGFGKQDIELVLEDGVLTVKGQITTDEKPDYIFKGIATRNFTREFTLADKVEIENAEIVNGMLKIGLANMVKLQETIKKIPLLSKE